MKTSDNIDKISASLAKAQGKLKTVAFNKTNPYFHSKYADITAIIEACKGVLSANELALIQGTELDGAEWVLTTRLQHSSGQFYESKMPLLMKQKDMQNLGSAITYARRYGMSSMLGISSDEDDDANASVSSTKSSREIGPQTQAKAMIKPTQRPQGSNQNMVPVSSIKTANAPQNKDTQDNATASVNMWKIEPGRPATQEQINKLFNLALDQKYEVNDLKILMKKLVQKDKSNDLMQEEFDVVYRFCRENVKTPQLMQRLT